MPDQKIKEGGRVTFERGVDANMMAIDGTWRRAFIVHDVSDDDATRTVDGSIQGLNLTEFFLLLSSTGLAYRRCKLERERHDHQCQLPETARQEKQRQGTIGNDLT